MKCSFCGSELEPGAGFCPNCGTIISLDNEFVSPKQPEPPAAQPPEQPESPAAQPAAPQEATKADFAESLSGMPAYVSPTFEAYQPAQTAPEQPVAPEEDDDDPFREMHPDLDDAPPVPPVIPVEAQIPDAQPVAADGNIPVYEPTEEIRLPEDEAYEDADDDDDMYVKTEKSKKGRVAAILVILLLLAAAVGAWYYVKTQNPFLQPTASQTDATLDTVSQPSATLPVSESESDTTEEPTEDTTDEDPTDEDTTDESATDESATDESTTDDATAISADENELTAPQDTTTTKAPTTTETTTKPATTTQRATTTTQRATTTTRRAVTTTTRRATTTTTRSAVQPTTQAANTLQRPSRTFSARTMYITTNGVALRYAPNRTSGNRVSLSVGADVSVTAEQNGYYFVRSNRYGISGWVSKQYVGTSRPVAQTQTTVSGTVAPDVTVNGGTKTVNSGSSLNLRKGPGTEYDVIRAISDGYPVAVKGKSSTVSGWVYVTDITRGVSGWVAESYLK